MQQPLNTYLSENVSRKCPQATAPSQLSLWRRGEVTPRATTLANNPAWRIQVVAIFLKINNLYYTCERVALLWISHWFCTTEAYMILWSKGHWASTCQVWFLIWKNGSYLICSFPVRFVHLNPSGFHWPNVLRRAQRLEPTTQELSWKTEYLAAQWPKYQSKPGAPSTQHGSPPERTNCEQVLFFQRQWCHGNECRGP